MLGRVGVVAARHQVAGSVQAPEKIQQPDAVLPSSRSMPEAGSCSPALQEHLGRILRIQHVRQRLAVDLLRELFGDGIVGIYRASSG